MSSDQSVPVEVDAVNRSAIVGTGAVGASWIALMLARGISVVAFDASPGAEPYTRSFVDAAWPALKTLGVATVSVAPHRELRFAKSLKDAVRGAQVVQESVTEKLELKHQVLGDIEAYAPPESPILSSTGGFTATALQARMRKPSRFAVLHPLNPAHLIPLVEVVGGDRTDAAIVEWVMAFARRLGKRPIRLRGERSGHMTNRLQFALVREAVACLMEGVASAEEIDEAIRDGLAPRWALMGPLLTLHMAGGSGGMKGILDHAGAAIASWWKPTPDVTMTWEVREALVGAAMALAGTAQVEALSAWRDDRLVDVLKLQMHAEAALDELRNA